MKYSSDGANGLPHATLEFRVEGHDKEYHLTIKEDGGSYVVEAAWGRRGQTLQMADKCRPTSLEAAERVFDKVVKEKLAKGYKHAATERAEDAVSTARDQSDDTSSDNARNNMKLKPIGEAYLPQLLNAITEGEMEAILRCAESNHWACQEKYDGQRRLLIKRGDVVTSLNKQGIERAIATEITEYAKSLESGDFVMDGETIGPDFYAFDLLETNRIDIRCKPYGLRYKELMRVIGVPNGWPIQPAPLIIGEKFIRKFIAELKARNAEGVVLKDLLAPYTAGRPNRGCAQFKHKFYATCSAIVVQQNEQRSIVLALYNEKNEGICIGNVTIPPNHEVPKPGEVIECRYLYVVKSALVQPVYLGTRDDVPQADCTFTKQNLKKKAGAE